MLVTLAWLGWLSLSTLLSSCPQIQVQVIYQLLITSLEANNAKISGDAEFDCLSRLEINPVCHSDCLYEVPEGSIKNIQVQTY